ncbi:MAG: indole-3-glycerol phosphate synthase TrpC [Ignavibacteriae bacterium]|nr:indole-3-glycerol phosphate synthase TrpC [Ignavibacteriota bacterium]
MNILQQIVEYKRDEVAKLKQKYSISDFQSFEFFQRKTISLRHSLNTTTPFAVIAEIKRASPSAGSLRIDIRPQTIAGEYESNGAAGISVLTDEKFFSGTIKDLSEVRNVVRLPLLRKDFIIDEHQLHEAKVAGADAVLLIAVILEKQQLSDLHSAASELGLESLVELYEEREIEKLDFDSMKLVGINNRDLKTMTIDINHSIELSRFIPKDTTLVSESGIHSTDGLRKLKDAGIKAALIGEYLMKSKQPGLALKQLLESTER